MKRLTLLLSAFLFLAPVAASAAPAICNPAFGAANRRLPSFCGINLVTQPAATPIMTQNTQNTDFSSIYGGMYANYTSKIINRNVNTLIKRPPSFYNQTRTIASPASYLRPADLTDVDVVLEPIVINESFNISTASFEVARVHIRNNYGNRGVYKSAAKLQNAEFLLEYVGGGLGDIDMTDFTVYINNTAHRVSQNGKVTASLGQERLLEGESKELIVKVGLTPQPVLPAYSGTFRLTMTNAKVTEENSRDEYSVAFISTKSTNNFAFGDVRTTLQSGGSVKVRTINPQGNQLLGGTRSPIMQLSITPEFASLELETLRIFNTTSGNAGGVFDSLELVQDNSGEVLDTSSFSGNSATFNVQNALLPINQSTMLTIYGNVYANPQNETLNLRLDGTNLEMQSLASGNMVDTSFIAFSGDDFPYTVSGGVLVFAHDDLPFDRFAVTGRPEAVYRFTATNPSGTDIYLNRMSLRTLIYGMAWDGTGLDADDVELYEVSDRGQRYNTNWVPTIIGDAIQFDNNTSDLILRGDTRTYELRLALRTLGNSDDDEVVISWLETGTSQTGSLSSLQSSGASTIWRVDQDGNDWQAGNSLIFPIDSYFRTRD